MTPAARKYAEDSWWRLPLAQLQAELSAGPGGLTASEAELRLRRFGPNALREVRRLPLVLQFLARFRNPLMLILLAASAVAAATGETASFAIIVTMVVLSVTLDFVQEHRAGRAAEKLRSSVAVRARVIRDGASREVDVRSLVCGDVLSVGAGDLIPGDARVIEAKDFFVQQALLTGEPYPVEKRASDTAGDGGIDAATNAVFMGSSVISGSARLLVCRTGDATAVGAIKGALEIEPPPLRSKSDCAGSAC